MKLSIITINYNNALGLKKTILSVTSQSVNDFEHIIIDGDSNDGSKEVILKNKSSFSYWVSEPDEGIYHAMNKGIEVANGEYLLFLNSGDELYDEKVIYEILPVFSKETDIVYGDLMFDSGSYKFKKTYPSDLSFSFFLKESLPHPATFIKKSLFTTIFKYNVNYKIVSDWEFFIYAICKKNVSYFHVENVISIFKTDGLSNNPVHLSLIEDERNSVLKEYFPLFINDYKDVFLLNNNRFKILKELEKNSVLKKINSVWLRSLLFLFSKDKNPKSL